MDALVLVVIAFFAFMGVVALAAPLRIAQSFEMRELTAAGRNEIRAVYGGFGLAIAAVLAFAFAAPHLRMGIALAVTAALIGMAGGRAMAAMIEAPQGFYPSWFYFLLETAMAAALIGWAIETPALN